MGGIGTLLLMVAYATAVAAGLIGITVLSVKVYPYVKYRVIKYTKYLSKISAIILACMAVGFAHTRFRF